MLVITRPKGTEVIIGDHTVVKILRVDVSSTEVRLGIDSRDNVERVSSQASALRAAQIRARVSHIHKPDPRGMREPIVYVAHTTHDDELQIKAAFTAAKATYPGATVRALGAHTYEAPAHHQFLTLRLSLPTTVNVLKNLAKQVLGWEYLDEIELEDASTYVLFIRTVPTKEGHGDVQYVDLVA